MDLHPGHEPRQVLEAKPDELRRVRRLRENQAWYQDLVEHSHDLLCVHDLEGHLLLVNSAPARLLGYSVEELLRIPMQELIAPEFRSQFDSYLNEIESNGEARGFLALITRSGERRIWQYYNTLKAEAGSAPIVRGIAHDVTEQMRTEKLLREAGEGLLREVRKNETTIGELRLFRALVDQSNDAIEVVDPETLRFLDVSEKACSALGYSREEMLSLRVHDIHPANTPLSLGKIREDLHKSGFFVLECRHQRKDGSFFPVEVSMRWVHLDRDYIVAVVRDLTERNQSAERLREYERVVEGLEEMIVVVDRDYRYVIANHAYLKYRDMKKEEVIGRRVDEVVHKEVFESLVRGKMEECFREGKVVAYDMKYAYPTLGERELFATYFPIEGPTGVERIAVILQDVTESKRAERALKESEEKFSKAFRQGPMAITITSIRDGRYIEVNETFERATGWRRAEVLGRTPLDIGLWVNPGERLELGARLLREGRIRNVETAFRMKNGSIRAVSITAERIEVNGEPCVIGAAVDISERKQAEQALRHSEENYRMFVAQSSEGIFREDMDKPISIDLPEDELIHHILYDSYLVECNDAMAAMYGLSSARELQGKRLTEMVPPEDPHNIELTRHYIQSGFRVLDRESHEIDVHGNPKVFLNSLIGTVENGMLVRTWGIQRDITEKAKLDESRQQAEQALRQNVAQLQLVTEELRLAKEKLSEEKLYLEQAIDTELGFGEIIGRSTALKDVMEKVAKVAPSDATVLLLGETGTGKELVARAIHRLSKRRENTFIKLNCAAIPSGLLESELFGHEKGAFTGAVAKKLGRLELADEGTLFLDEIGEVSLDLQPKLLRVLQDQEFERLGGTQTLKVNFRLIAATNRDLLESVNRREFRTDLYYRLNVFPLRTPPLRERREDIPLLIEHFVRKYASRMNKSILSIPAKTMETLMQWGWPGNIRELENFVERSVILTPGSVLQVPLNELHADIGREESETLHDAERERILRALRECNGQLGGPNGAAARLGLKRTTLQSKLNAFGINPGGYRA
ncbi:MAG: PAS domain S-box protein [Candidatus Sulfotelmatobacter sp.]